MNDPRRHHYNPEFYLGEWAGPDGLVCEIKKAYGKVEARRRSPKATGFERDLYRTDGVPDAQYVEKNFMSRLDNDAARALQKICAARRAGPGSLAVTHGCRAGARASGGSSGQPNCSARLAAIPASRAGLRHRWGPPSTSSPRRAAMNNHRFSPPSPAVSERRLAPHARPVVPPRRYARARSRAAAAEQAALSRYRPRWAHCESACKKDPLFGVIGFQSAPRHRGSPLASMILGSRGWDAGRGDDCKDPPRVF